MGKVLVEASKVTCGAVSPHRGSIGMTGAARLVVDGSRALTTRSVVPPPAPPPLPPYPGCTNEASAGGPCTNVAFINDDPSTGRKKGVSTRLKVDGEFVVLDSLQATTDRGSAVEVDRRSVNNDVLEAE
jgi:hypothetical protein